MDISDNWAAATAGHDNNNTEAARTARIDLLDVVVRLMVSLLL